MLQVVERVGPIDADDAGLVLGVAGVGGEEEGGAVAVSEGGEAVRDQGVAGGEEGVGVEVEWGCLVGGLEDVGEVGEEDIGEEMAELFVQDPLAVTVFTQGGDGRGCSPKCV